MLMKGISSQELLHHIIRPTLCTMDLGSESSENLLLGTAAHESYMGYYLTQQGGPALGIYQIEPATHYDLWHNYLNYRQTLSEKLRSFLPASCTTIETMNSQLISNLVYSTAIARMIYYRVTEPLPKANDIASLALYWKKYYNTYLGKGKEEDFISHYQKYIG